MSKKFVRIPVSGPATVIVSDGDDYETLRNAVGGSLEAVGLPGGHSMYLDEEGKIKHLPVNDTATRITRSVLSPYDMVVGDVVIAGPVDAWGDDTEADLDVVRSVFGVSVES